MLQISYYFNSNRIKSNLILFFNYSNLLSDLFCCKWGNIYGNENYALIIESSNWNQPYRRNWINFIFLSKFGGRIIRSIKVLLKWKLSLIDIIWIIVFCKFYKGKGPHHFIVTMLCHKKLFNEYLYDIPIW